MQLSEIRKTVINVATAIVAATPWILDAEHVVTLPGPTLATISFVLGAAVAVVHYFVPNETTDPAVAATSSVRLKKPPTARTAGRNGRPSTSAHPQV